MCFLPVSNTLHPDKRPRQRPFTRWIIVKHSLVRCFKGLTCTQTSLSLPCSNYVVWYSTWHHSYKYSWFRPEWRNTTSRPFYERLWDCLHHSISWLVYCDKHCQFSKAGSFYGIPNGVLKMWSLDCSIMTPLKEEILQIKSSPMLDEISPIFNHL